MIVGFGLGAVALVQFGTLTQALMVAGVAVLITSLEGFLLTPFLQGKAAKMNSVAVFVGILFWSWMWGPIGLLLAVPLTTVVKVVCDHVEQLQPVGHGARRVASAMSVSGHYRPEGRRLETAQPARRDRSKTPVTR